MRFSASARSWNQVPSFVGAVDAAIPDDDLAGAVLAFRDHAFERAVVVRVILGHHRQAFVVAVQRRSFRHCPGLQHAVAFEPEVVMQPSRRMLLHDEKQQARRPNRRLPGRAQA